MLVLSRKPGQRTLIGDSIVVTVIEVSPGRVRLGIEAPTGVRILREELIEGRIDCLRKRLHATVQT
jgi:carbon storage regulator